MRLNLMSANNVTKIGEFPNNKKKRNQPLHYNYTTLHNSPKRDGLKSKPAASTSSFLCPSSREHPLKNAKHSFISLDGGLGFPILRHTPHNAYSIFSRPLKFSGNSTSLKICLCFTATFAESSDSVDCCLAKLVLRFLRATVVKWNVARGKVTTDNFDRGGKVKIAGFRHTNAGCFAICTRGIIAETTCMMQCNVLHWYILTSGCLQYKQCHLSGAHHKIHCKLHVVIQASADWRKTNNFVCAIGKFHCSWCLVKIDRSRSKLALPFTQPNTGTEWTTTDSCMTQIHQIYAKINLDTIKKQTGMNIHCRNSSKQLWLRLFTNMVITKALKTSNTRANINECGIHMHKLCQQLFLNLWRTIHQKMSVQETNPLCMFLCASHFIGKIMRCYKTSESLPIQKQTRQQNDNNKATATQPQHIEDVHARQW